MRSIMAKRLARANRRGEPLLVYIPAELKRRLEAAKERIETETPRDELPKYFGMSDLVRDMIERGVSELERKAAKK